jgi:Predicted pyridoxal phosphate-dependent enzyme apparently involved in regulation of cell wall biogenesis
MGFYSLMKILDIKQGDEVILQGYTCSVMPNAIFRLGATPIYADISLHNLGTSPESVKNLISENTKMIVVQHSFGIPCEVEEIKKICEERDIFLLEDCAISLGSKVHGIQIGNFGDAALYSFDHSKPINAMTGGIIYSTNNELINSLMKIQENTDHFSARHNPLLFNEFLRERRICITAQYGRDDLYKSFKKFSIKKYA